MKSSLIITISLLAVSLSGQAATLSLESCAAIEGPIERLACYDMLAGRLPADTLREQVAQHPERLILLHPRLTSLCQQLLP